MNLHLCVLAACSVAWAAGADESPRRHSCRFVGVATRYAPRQVSVPCHARDEMGQLAAVRQRDSKASWYETSCAAVPHHTRHCRAAPVRRARWVRHTVSVPWPWVAGRSHLQLCR